MLSTTKKTLPIGVFDSGMGGLTVLRALRNILPGESYIYLGDTARLPYGTKSPETILQYASQMTRILVEKCIKALVIACNTATTAALPQLQTMLPDIPVIGVVEPGAGAAIAATKNHKIAVLATETTITSQAYQRLISETLPQAIISTRACSVLVALAEEGMVANTVARAALQHYLSEFTDEDTLLLGCTHFPVFKSLLTTLLPEKVVIVDSALATAKTLFNVLSQANLCNPSYSHDSNYSIKDISDANMSIDSCQPRRGSVNYLVTDSIQRFQNVGKIFLDEPIPIQYIELLDVRCST